MNRYSSSGQNPTQLPLPSEEALAHSAVLVEKIKTQIQQSGQQAISYEEYMQLALYAPGFGYYAVGTEKLGQSGDFVTAPEISPLFGQCIANQCAEVFANLSSPGDILELGAGTGRLAQSVLQHLEQIDALPAHYYILEVSPDLKARQQELLAQHLSPVLFSKCIWIDILPQNFSGIILANEVLDALAVRRFVWNPTEVLEVFVGIGEQGFQEKLVPADHSFAVEVRALAEKYGQEWPALYCSEINQRMTGLINSLGTALKQGMILLIDYGFPAHEFYHAQRNTGTLACHYRHHVHHDPYFYPGLQDITSHVDFTCAAKAAREAGLDIAGFTTQAGFLLGSGLMDISLSENESSAVQFQINQQIQQLTSPAEMGELFKVLALSKNCEASLLFVDFFARSL